jgi:ribosomal protein S18 acetylase RimI-like enzyme
VRVISQVRRAEPADAAAIAAVYVETWRNTYRGLLPDGFLDALSEEAYEERWRRSLAGKASRAYVAMAAGNIAGFASCGPERAGEDGYAGELYAIYVRREEQGRGHGRRLVQAAARGLGEMGFDSMIVWVLRDNHRARLFYERLGGTYVREQPLTIGSAVLQEVSYAWKGLERLA